MNDPLTARYLAHIAASGLDSQELIESVLAAEHLVDAYGDRWTTRPALLEADQVAGLERDLSRLYALLASLPGRLFGGDLRAAGRAAGMTDYQIDAVVRTARDSPISLGRADLYHNGSGFELLEFNIVSAVGGLENAELNRLFLRNPAVAGFVAEAGLDYVDTMAVIADVIKAECALIDAADVPVVAITDTPPNFAPFKKRFEHMAGIWSAMGLEGIACPLDRFEERSGRLFADGRRVDAVYRYFLMEDLLDPDGRGLIEPVLRAAEKGAAVLLSSMDAELHGSKAMFALLCDDANRSAFTAGEAELIDRFLPWTRMVRDGLVTVDGTRADMMDYARAAQCGLVLKPTLMHGGIGVVPGWTVGEAQWLEHVRAAAGGPYVLQRRVRPAPEDFPVAGRPGAVEPIFLNWGVFLVGDKYAGTLIRGTADPDVGVLSRATGARIGCCFHRAVRGAGRGPATEAVRGAGRGPATEAVRGAGRGPATEAVRGAGAGPSGEGAPGQ